jgi:hypothetical protein
MHRLAKASLNILLITVISISLGAAQKTEYFTGMNSI